MKKIKINENKITICGTFCVMCTHMNMNNLIASGVDFIWELFLVELVFLKPKIQKKTI